MGANRFFDELSEFSSRVFDHLGLEDQHPDDALFNTGEPRGAVIHFTRSTNFFWTIKYFLETKIESHVLVADFRDARLEHLLDGLPLVNALPCTVVQFRPPGQTADHATWTNPYCYGIENMNGGDLLPSEAGWLLKNGQPWTPGRGGDDRRPVGMFGRYWAPYPWAQVQTNLEILNCLSELTDLIPGWVIGHEQLQGVRTPRSSKKDKRDPGPAYPLMDVRRAVFVDDLAWRDLYVGDPRYGEARTDGLVIDWAREDGRDVGAIEAWEYVYKHLASWQTGNWGFARGARRALELLGYHVLAEHEAHAEETLDLALYLFCRMSGLSTARRDARKLSVRHALWQRLDDRGLFHFRQERGAE